MSPAPAESSTPPRARPDGEPTLSEYRRREQSITLSPLEQPLEGGSERRTSC